MLAQNLFNESLSLTRVAPNVLPEPMTNGHGTTRVSYDADFAHNRRCHSNGRSELEVAQEEDFRGCISLDACLDTKDPLGDWNFRR